MSYEIHYSDLVSVRTQIVNYVNTVETQLSDLGKSYDALLKSGCMTGKSADTLNAYVYYIHVNLLSQVSSMLQEYMTKLLVYENGLHSLEGNRDAIIFEEELTLLEGALTRAKKKYCGITGDVTKTLSSVNDIYSHGAPDTASVCDAYENTKRIATTFKTAVGRYEHQHRNDCKQVNEYITKIKSILASQQNGQNGTITVENIEQIVNGQAFQDLYKLQESTNKFGNDHKLAIQKEYSLMKTEAEEEAARQREIDGVIKVLTGVVVVASVVATGGATAPLAIALEVGAVSYGAAEITEGVENVFYGASGDITIPAFNPLRDTIFCGNQTAYDVFGMVATIGNSGASQLAKQGITITTKNLAEASAKEGIKQLASNAAGYGAGEVADKFGASDGQRQFISIAVGLGTNYGMNKVNGLKINPVSNEERILGKGAYNGNIYDGSGFGKLADKQIGVSQKGIDIVEKHLSGEFSEVTNDAMIARLKTALANGEKLTGAEASFYMHEISETTMMNSGIPYEEAHAAALAKYDVSPFSVYSPEVIKQYPDMFGRGWKKFWNIK